MRHHRQTGSAPCKTIVMKIELNSWKGSFGSLSRRRGAAEARAAAVGQETIARRVAGCSALCTSQFSLFSRVSYSDAFSIDERQRAAFAQVRLAVAQAAKRLPPRAGRDKHGGNARGSVQRRAEPGGARLHRRRAEPGHGQRNEGRDASAELDSQVREPPSVDHIAAHPLVPTD